jgi:hypothetical protein
MRLMKFWLNSISCGVVANSKRSTGLRAMTSQRQRQMSASLVFIPQIEENEVLVEISLLDT